MSSDVACPVPLERSLVALRTEGAALDPIVAALGDADWTRDTRLPAWTLRELVAHLVRGVTRVHAYLSGPEPPRPEVDWLGYWRAARQSDPAGVALRSVELATTLSNKGLADGWQRGWRSAVEHAVESEPTRVMQTPFGAMRLDHYLSTRVVEVVVHGLDLRHALGLEEVATPAGLEIASAVLDGLLALPRPVDLEREPVRFVLAATGRVPHDDPDLPVLT